MAKLRLMKPEMADYTGHIGMTYFENGVSVDDVSPQQINLISAVTLATVVTDDAPVTGDDWTQAGPSANLVNALKLQAEVEAPMLIGDPEVPPSVITPADQEIPYEDPKPKTADDILSREIAVAEKALERAEQEMDAVRDQLVLPLDTTVYARADLEKIADDDGIDGLRKIATPLNIKGRQITELIDKILAANPAAPASDAS